MSEFPNWDKSVPPVPPLIHHPWTCKYPDAPRRYQIARRVIVLTLLVLYLATVAYLVVAMIFHLAVSH